MRETIFPETHEWFEQKFWEKNRREKLQKKVFLHSHEYRYQKSGGKKRTQFFFPETQE